jgi:hypothetical protein
LANRRSLPPLNLELKDLEDFDPNVSIEGCPPHLRKDPRGLGGPDEFASHLQEQRTSNCGKFLKNDETEVFATFDLMKLNFFKLY